jgi:hypothetical protein
MSVLVPGAGEIYMGYYKRGAALVALEAGAWTGYVHFNNKGLDSRERFERFADSHWSIDRWIQNHPVTECGHSPSTPDDMDAFGVNPCPDPWPGYHLFASKEAQKQNYYENIGKYDWFISGWDDWDLATKPRNTDIRQAYRDMRKKSNDELSDAKKFIALSIATRVFSIVEMFVLLRDDGVDTQAGNAERRFSLSTRPTGFSSGEIAFTYRFK